MKRALQPVLIPALLLTAALPIALPDAALAASQTVTSTANTNTKAAPGPLVLQKALAGLPVATEQRDGYQRTSFKHWIDVDRDGCSTRNEVLMAEAVAAPQVGERCQLSGGSWYSYYDDVTVSEAAGLDVDHLVPLAEAWDSGAFGWDAAKRQAYANDLDAPYHLVAVTARSNRSKADKDPGQWLPPHENARCRYAAEWTAVKRRWELSVDAAEKAALEQIAGQCPNTPLPDAPAVEAR